MPIFGHFPSICPQNSKSRLPDLRICCTNIKPVIKMYAVRLQSPGTTHQKLLAESRVTVTSLQTFTILRCSQVLQRSNNYECLRVGKTILLKTQSTTHSVFSFNTLLNYSVCTTSAFSHVFFNTG